jgi:hypothetical protein
MRPSNNHYCLTSVQQKFSMHQSHEALAQIYALRHKKLFLSEVSLPLTPIYKALVTVGRAPTHSLQSTHINLATWPRVFLFVPLGDRSISAAKLFHG